MRVLIVDDDSLFLDSVAELVADEGHEVVGRAANGAEAVERALELRPDVVLMDVDMPVMDGVAATRQIVSQLRGTRVVIVSGSAVEAHVLGAHTAGAVAHIRKPQVVEHLPIVLGGLAQDIEG
jgi:two-component system chemotaxis response regulator CheY